MSTERPRWTFLTNYGHVLLCVYRDPEARLRDIADEVGITERAVQAIVGDLVADGYLEKIPQGRRNTYAITHDAPMRHPASGGHAIGELLAVLASAGSPKQES